MMVDDNGDDAVLEDDYDEEADSDFDANNADDAEISSSSDEDRDTSGGATKRGKRTAGKIPEVELGELDSGDEATIKDQKSKRKHRSKTGDAVDEIDKEDEGWRAKTRAMRVQEKQEKQQRKLASMQTSTIDVDKLWEEMNKAGPLPPVRMEGGDPHNQGPQEANVLDSHIQNKENLPASGTEEMITIKRKFKFAGETHVEEKVVPKSSAEARLWLAQQDGKPQTPAADGDVKQRPLRKISRFDPNYHNLAAFRTNWAKMAEEEQFKGPKLNVVEKSKMDWAVHVDAEGLKDELDVHARAKDAYLNRMDFLGEVEQRKEAEARMARMKG